MKRNKRIYLEDYSVLQKCAWCKKRIPKKGTLFSISVQISNIFDLSSYEGIIIRLQLSHLDREISGIIPANDSDAKKEGYNISFVVCSESCGFSLKTALRKEKEILKNKS